MLLVRRTLAALFFLLGTGLMACLSAGDAVGASKIVYECDPDLCVVDPATGIGSKVTGDGASYRDPSLSADGTKLAAGRGLDVVVGAYGGNLSERWGGSEGLNDVALAPSGAAVAESHAYVRNRYGCPLTGGCLELVDESGATYSVGALGAGGETTVRGGGGVGFLGTGALLTSFYTIGDDAHTICAVVDPLATGAPCATQIVSVGRVLADPAGSADGKLIAATSGVADDKGIVASPSVNLYDGATGGFLRTLATGAEAAFSPDGSEVAYSGADGWIHLVSVAGGGDRRLVAGSAPTWSAAPDPRLSSLPKSLAYRKGKLRTKLRCAGPTPCGGKLRLLKGRSNLARANFKIAPAASKAVVLKASKRGRSLLGAGSVERATLRVSFDEGKTLTKQLRLRN